MDLASLRADVVDHPVLALAGYHPHSVAATVRALASPSPRKQSGGGSQPTPRKQKAQAVGAIAGAAGEAASGAASGAVGGVITSGAAGKRKASPRVTRGSRAKTARFEEAEGSTGLDQDVTVTPAVGGSRGRTGIGGVGSEEVPCTPSPGKRGAARRPTSGDDAAPQTPGGGSSTSGGGDTSGGGGGGGSSGSGAAAAEAAAAVGSAANDVPTEAEQADALSGAEQPSPAHSTSAELSPAVEAAVAEALDTRPPRKRVALLNRGNGKVFPSFIPI